jgi:hypothetical protein
MNCPTLSGMHCLSMTRARRPETKEKRLAQMLVELERGNKYMNMDYRPKRRG